MHDRTRRHPHPEGRPHFHRHGHHPHRGEGVHGRRHSRGAEGRVRRGEARYVILDALRDGPKHGYEIIKTMEERSSGQYAPSPGTVYPTLQYLEDMGLVRADAQTDRRVYHLTETGCAELDVHAEEINAFWARLEGSEISASSQAEISFLQDELEYLSRTVWGGLQDAQTRNEHETIRRIRQAVEHCRNEIRRIIAEPDSDRKE